MALKTSYSGSKEDQLGAKSSRPAAGNINTWKKFLVLLGFELRASSFPGRIPLEGHPPAQEHYKMIVTYNLAAQNTPHKTSYVPTFIVKQYHRLKHQSKLLDFC
jgi:hypothetical protein